MFWILYAFLSSVFMAGRSVFGKKILQHEHALEYGAAQGFLSMIILAIAALFVPVIFGWFTYVSIYVISLVFVVGNIYYLKSIRHGSLSSMMPLMNFTPLFLLVIAATMLGEQPSARAIIGVMLLLVGTYVLQISTIRKGFFEPFKHFMKSKYSLYMVFAMFVYAFTAAMEKSVINAGVNAIGLFVVLRFFVGFNYVILETVQHGFREIIADLKKDGSLIVGSTVVAQISYLFYYLALGVPGAMVSLIIPVKRLSTLFSVIAGGKMFGERRMGIKLLGSAVMLIGVVLIVL